MGRAPGSGSPYTVPPELAKTSRRQPASRAAVARAMVPRTLTRASCSGSATLRRTSIWAARWYTTSGRASATTSASSGPAASTSASSTRPEASASARFSRRPVDRSSTTVTRCPAAASRSTTAEPMKPEPPVTSVRMPRSPLLGVGQSGHPRASSVLSWAAGSFRLRRAGQAGGEDVQEAARPVTAGTRVVAATRGWLLPYLLIAVVCMVELLTGRRVIVGGFLVLAPLLASRLSTRRSQVIAVGLVTLVAATAVGLYTSSMAAGQLFIRLLLITLATLFALVNWGAAQREQSALERAADTIRMAGSLAGLEPEEAYDLLARSARTLYAANAAAVYRRQGEQMLAVAHARDPEVPAMPHRLARASFPAAFMTVTRRVGVRSEADPEAPMLEARGLASLLWLPLLDRAGEQLGTIVLAWKRDPKLSAQELEASESFASLGARAISGSERVRAQTEVLEQVQALLLTTPPGWVAGFRIAVRYQSA